MGALFLEILTVFLGSIIYYHKRGLLKFGGGGGHTKLWAAKRGEHKIFLLTGGTEDFHKKGFSRFYPSLALKSAEKPFFLNI